MLNFFIFLFSGEERDISIWFIYVYISVLQVNDLFAILFSYIKLLDNIVHNSPCGVVCDLSDHLVFFHGHGPMV